MKSVCVLWFKHVVYITLSARGVLLVIILDLKKTLGSWGEIPKWTGFILCTSVSYGTLVIISNDTASLRSFKRRCEIHF